MKKDFEYFTKQLHALEKELSDEFSRIGDSIIYVWDEDNDDDRDADIQDLECVEVRYEVSGNVKDFRPTSVNDGIVWGFVEDDTEENDEKQFRFSDLADTRDRITLINLMQYYENK
tara:strand:+ start:9338 stop:9685 length:348 start_codon:yes stop_codon:yes gene_type:complete